MNVNGVGRNRGVCKGDFKLCEEYSDFFEKYSLDRLLDLGVIFL